MLILRAICKRIFLNPISIKIIDFCSVNISRKTTNFACTRSGTKTSFKQKRDPFNSSPFNSSTFNNNPFAKFNASTASPIDRSSPFFSCQLVKYYSRSVYFNAAQGFKICFHCTPVQSVVSRVSDQNAIIQNEIVSLLKRGAIVQVPFSQNGFYNRLLLAAKKGGGQRLVLDLIALK